MRVTQVYRHECEGCGAVKHLDFQRAEFGSHHSFGKYRNTEADCINARRQRDKEDQERQEAEERKYRTLIEACAKSEDLHKLCQAFPGEDGSGSHWKLFDKVIQDVAKEADVYGTYSYRTVTNSGHEQLLRECIKVAREAV